MLSKNATILFQGDSITDGGRSRNEDLNHVMGHGYAYLVAARLGADHPELGLRFLNRGCSGNRVVDMYGRWREDALNLKPDVISILIGVNDVGSEFKRNAGVPAAKYEKVYRLVLEESREALPGVRFVLMEPFYVPLQDRFDAACRATGVEYWLWDGVHPMPAGHERIARTWLAAVKGI
jgi:lysophospholipase L1-like esterase